MEEDRVPEPPPKSHDQKRRRPGNVSKRVQSCTEFAVERIRYPSIDEFVREKCEESVDIVEWQSSKAQVVRDMRRIFGRNCAAKRGRGAKAREAIDERTGVAPGLTVPPNV